MEEQSYTSTHPLGHTGPVTASLYFYINKYNSLLAGNRNVNQSSRFAYKGMLVSEVTARYNSSVNVVCCQFWQFTRGSGFLRMSKDGS